MKYLTNEQLSTNLSLGKSIEQWLSFETKEGYTVLQWIRIDKEKDSTYSVSYIECFDDGNKDYFDIYNYTPIDPDEEYVINNFKFINEAIDFAIKSYSASKKRFVTAGMIQEEYKDYIKQRHS